MKNLPLNTQFDSAVFKELNNKPQKWAVNDIIMNSLAEVPQGANFDEMATRVAVIQKIKQAITNKEKSVLLESNEHTELVRALKARKYAVIDTAIYDYIKETDALKDASIKLETVKNKSAKNQ